MKAYLIDPTARAVTQVECRDYRDMQRHVGADCLDFLRINTEGDRIGVDDMGLVDGKQHGRFLVETYPNELAGRAIVFGCDQAGETTEPVATLEEITEMVAWCGEKVSGKGADVTGAGAVTTITAKPGQPVTSA